MPKHRLNWIRRRYPECVLAALACLVFLGALGSLELWGKREQRAVAESIDTIDNGHWLVAEIQGRPRLEKPPLPRWTTAMLMMATGQRDEWLMRLPAALSALGMVGLVYGLGRRMGGRRVGLAAGLALLSLPFFVVEMRQAGNDGPLSFFVTLAIYCAWRRLHGGAANQPPGLPGDLLGRRGWSLACYAAMGLGFLCKGPIALMLVAFAVVPYLIVTRRFRSGVRALFDAWGLLILVALILSWPVPVLVSDPRALDVWLLEMGQKAGTAGITHHRWRGPLATEWPAMTAPWTIFATIALAVPIFYRKQINPSTWMPWFWTITNLAMFCFWSVAKPNYFLPCMPAVALLCGSAWFWVVERMGEPGRVGRFAQRLTFGHILVLGLIACATPVVSAVKFPALLGWSIAGAMALLAGLAAAMGLLWRRRHADSLLALVSAFSLIIVGAYAFVGPRFNTLNGHHELARRIAELVPESEKTVLFYNELDEGLWYYLPGHRLEPVRQPRYNKALDLLDDFKAKRIIWDDAERFKAEARALVRALASDQQKSSYLLIKAKVYDMFARDLSGLAEPIYREPDRERNELMLLRLSPPSRAAVAGAPPGDAPSLRR